MRPLRRKGKDDRRHCQHASPEHHADPRPLQIPGAQHRTGEGLLHAGVLGKVELLRFSYAMINGLTVTEKHENGTVTLGLRLETVGGIDNVRAVATLVSGSGQIYYGGLTRGRGSILVRDPLYWWPRGLGIQNLYRLTVNLYGDTEVEDTLEVFIGLSSITTVGGGSALLEANGVRFLPMGAVFRPDSACDPVIARKKTEAAVISAARAGFNTLVVPFGSERPLTSDTEKASMASPTPRSRLLITNSIPQLLFHSWDLLYHILPFLSIPVSKLI